MGVCKHSIDDDPVEFVVLHGIPIAPHGGGMRTSTFRDAIRNMEIGDSLAVEIGAITLTNKMGFMRGGVNPRGFAVRTTGPNKATVWRVR